MRPAPRSARRRNALAGLAAALCLGASGCGPPLIVILWPPPDGTITFMPQEIEIAFAPTLDPATLQVVLNGVDITAWFAMDDSIMYSTRARAYEVGAPELLSGANLLVASIELDGGATQTAMAAFDTVGGDPYVDAVPDHFIGPMGGFNAGLLPGIVEGPPAGAGLYSGGTDVVSLGSAGWIELAFDDNAIVDGPGDDFLVFENPFLSTSFFVTGAPFAEPGRVSVSQDGATWYTFPCDLVQPPLPLVLPFYPGCAGVYPVLSSGESPHPSHRSTVPIEDLLDQDVFVLPIPEGAGGDGFDLADLHLRWIRYVRIDGADFVTAPAGASTFGFDLDAVAAIHSIPATDANMDGIPDALP